ncbi:MAG: RHS repeat-associated core domain-containing protein, partial [Pyrinomonadaceae bacterium]
LGNGKWESAKYNSRLQPTEIALGKTQEATNLLRLEYDYGTSALNNGSLRGQKITVPTAGGGSGFTAIQTYAYDSLNRLQSASETVGGSQTWKQTFTIDRYGNRRFDAANTSTLGSCPQTVCNPTISTSNNRISSSGYIFDANGSVTQDAQGQRFGYDAENHQKEFFVIGNSSSTPDATYQYDGEGRRVKKISSTETTVFVYNGTGQLVAEYSTALAQTQQVSYLTTDHLGSPRVTTNEDGLVTGRKDYSAFGEESFSAQRTSSLGYTGGDELRKGYTGYEKDSESGLDFAQARYYNSTHGRYTSIDPLTASASIRNPQTFNRYSYVLNSPYKFTDPLGLIPVTTGACGGSCPNSGPTGGYSSSFDGCDPKKDKLCAERGPNGEPMQLQIGGTPGELASVPVDASSAYQEIEMADLPIREASLVNRLAVGVSQGVSDAAEGMLRGAGDFGIGTVNSLTQPGGLIGSILGVQNPFSIKSFTYDNARQYSYGSATEVGMGFGLMFAGGAVRGGSTLSMVPGGASRGSFVGPRPLPYDPRVRARALEDPVGHNFPFSFDNVILSHRPTVKSSGYRIFQKPGHLNNKAGVYEIGVTPKFVIDHRHFRSH